MANEYRVTWTGLEAYHVGVAQVRFSWAGLEVLHGGAPQVLVSWTGIEVFRSIATAPPAAAPRGRAFLGLAVPDVDIPAPTFRRRAYLALPVVVVGDDGFISIIW